MDFYTIANNNFNIVVATQGGAIIKAQYKAEDILREHVNYKNAFNILSTGCFPLVPFGNRIENNTFSFENATYEVFKNIEFDPLHLHGNGWLETWQLHSYGYDSISLKVNVDFMKNPYSYEAYQHFKITENEFTITLEVINKGKKLPFGLGFHPFFPLTKDTMLLAKARCYWTEKEYFLPDEKKALESSIDFNSFRIIEHRWINNCFEGWDGNAIIFYPHNALNIHVKAPLSSYYFLFVSNREFEKDYTDDYFCFEPMTHCANAHKLNTLGGLQVLNTEQSLSLTMSLSPYFSQYPR